MTAKRRSELRAEAHRLTPVVIIGDKGLTEEVIAEIERSLKAHELIKVRAASADREARIIWLAAICTRLEAHAVQQIGKVFVIYRENPQEKAPQKSGPGKVRPPQQVGDPRPRSGARGDEQKASARGEEQKTGLRVTESKRRESTSTAKARARAEDVKRTSRPRSRTPSPPRESAPRRRRPRTSR